MKPKKYQYNLRNQTFNFTIVEIQGKPWFVATEICKLLGLPKATIAVKSLSLTEKQILGMPLEGPFKQYNLVNECGLYVLILKSRKRCKKHFLEWVKKEVIPTFQIKSFYGQEGSESLNLSNPYHRQFKKAKKGYFSIVDELYIRLNVRLAAMGYIIPSKTTDDKEIKPEISVGRMFKNYLNMHYPHKANRFESFVYKLNEKAQVKCKQYPIEFLPIFISFLENIWFPERAAKYFFQRDKMALKYLSKI